MDYCMCVECGKYFDSAHAFSMHRWRVATVTHKTIQRTDDKTCASTDDMIEVGMTKDDDDIWTAPLPWYKRAY
jgi:hypothetical protein